MYAPKLSVLMLALTIVAPALTPGTAPVAAQVCEGDCNGDGSVSIDELIAGVSIALGSVPTAECRAVDADGNGVVAINELLAAVRRALQGCSAAPTSTATIVDTPTPTATVRPTSAAEAALAGSARIATDPMFRIFDLQQSINGAVFVVARARRTVRDSSGTVSGGIPGCQQFDCEIGGTQEVCCAGTELNQVFDRCTFTDEVGTATLTGQFTLSGPASTICSGAIPTNASFSVVLSSFTYDIAFPDGGFARTVQQLSESLEFAPGDCTVSELDFFGLGARGIGRRLFNGQVRRFRTDGDAIPVVSRETAVDRLEIAVQAREDSDACRAVAELNGFMTGSDALAGTKFTSELTDFQVVQDLRDGRLFLDMSGTIGTDCLGDVTVSTVDPVQVTADTACFTSGSLQTQIPDGTVAVGFTEDGGAALDFGADGSPDQLFESCADVPIGQCTANFVGLCSACDDSQPCQRGLGCFSCADDCTGDTKRCAFSDAFLSCQDGVF